MESAYQREVEYLLKDNTCTHFKYTLESVFSLATIHTEDRPLFIAILLLHEFRTNITGNIEHLT